MSKSNAKLKMTYTTLAEEVRAALRVTRVRCSVCQHPRREEIDECLRQGLPNTAVARILKLSEAAVRRHRANHIVERTS